ncbi:hypothetical protein CTEN210_16139 [Chaetoceros tenuissimus]|uniref:Uncharacterized protein n=1 Tax=Chaetoceros tenuissimus TaxID=426638 RepID=A0AAD3D8B1_9STRA|nr:hypothetical protein CTEN210_16139 [Chaetoceros tenuissimus]
MNVARSEMIDVQHQAQRKRTQTARRRIEALDPNKVYRYEQIGQSIEGVAGSGDLVGSAVAMNESGNIIAVGAEGRNYYQGSVTVYEYNASSNTWTQLGNQIQGLTSDVYFGSSVALSNDGYRLVAGAPNEEYYSGSVLIYDYNASTNTWELLGDTLTSDGYYGKTGTDVSINGDGSILAFSAPALRADWNATVPNDDYYSEDYGHVYIFTFAGSGWIQMGNTIMADDKSFLGGSISLSDDGNRIAVGSPKSQAGNYYYNAGGVEIYELVNNVWVQIGDTIFGTENYGNFGEDVVISGNGQYVIIGSPNDDTGTGENAISNTGEVKVYQEVSGTWTQIGQTFSGVSLDDSSGKSVVINYDGSVIAFGTPQHDTTITNEGKIEIFQYKGDDWEQIGPSINGGNVGGRFGTALAMSKDGAHIIVGGEFFGDYYDGNVEVYQAVELTGPTATPTANPTDTASAKPSFQPSSLPSVSLVPTMTISESPSSSHNPTLSITPSNLPSSQPSISALPFTIPSLSPSTKSSESPSILPSSLPTSIPSSLSTTEITDVPSSSSKPSTFSSESPSPSSVPSQSPSEKYATIPSMDPSSSNNESSESPSLSPGPTILSSESPLPSISPSSFPSSTRTEEPSLHPSQSSNQPFMRNSEVPSITSSPTAPVINVGSNSPSKLPSITSESPSTSNEPNTSSPSTSLAPSTLKVSDSTSPSISLAPSVSDKVTISPSTSIAPTQPSMTMNPSSGSTSPTNIGSDVPTTTVLSLPPSVIPTLQPSDSLPTGTPSRLPTKAPTDSPTKIETSIPTKQSPPTKSPTMKPSSRPSQQPTIIQAIATKVTITITGSCSLDSVNQVLLVQTVEDLLLESFEGSAVIEDVQPQGICPANQRKLYGAKLFNIRNSSNEKKFKMKNNKKTVRNMQRIDVIMIVTGNLAESQVVERLDSNIPYLSSRLTSDLAVIEVNRNFDTDTPTIAPIAIPTTIQMPTTWIYPTIFSPTKSSKSSKGSKSNKSHKSSKSNKSSKHGKSGKSGKARNGTSASESLRTIQKQFAIKTSNIFKIHNNFFQE